MLKRLAVLAVFSLTLLFGVNSAMSDVFPGKIIIYPDRQEIQFPIVAGVIRGLACVDIILPQDIERVIFNSDRVGWQDNSITQTTDINQTSCTINGTPNNDTRSIWCIKLKSGKFCYFNLDPAPGSSWEISSVIPNALQQPRLMIENQSDGGRSYFVEYGKYQPSSILFDGPRSRFVVRFNCNIICGFVNDGRINPADIKKTLWNSGKVGWLENSIATGAISSDADGNFTTTISHMPQEDLGNFCLNLTDGTNAWMNIDSWKFERAKVSLDHQNGFIQYKFLAGVPPAVLNLLLE